jgi:hypothetical protein
VRHEVGNSHLTRSDEGGDASEETDENHQSSDEFDPGAEENDWRKRAPSPALHRRPSEKFLCAVERETSRR